MSIGIVAVLRSFLNSQDLLEAVQNKLAAIRILDARMNDLEEKMKEETPPKGAVLPKETAAQAEQPEGASEEEIMLTNRKAVLKTEIRFLDKSDEKNGEKASEVSQTANPVYYTEEIKLTLSWKEGAKNKDEILAGYFEKKK